MKFGVRSAMVWVLGLLLLAACGPSSSVEQSVSVVESTPAVAGAPGAEAQGATAPATTEAPAYTVALVMKTLTNPFFVEMEKGARRAEQELGIDLIVKTGAQETSIEQQITIVGDLVDQHVDAIVIAPADSSALIPALKAAQDAGIVIVNIDNQLDAQVWAEKGLTNVPFISVDNEQGAYSSAKVLSDRLDKPAKVAVLEGIRTAKNAMDRKNGALRAFAENPNIIVVAQETANWKIDEAHDVIARIFAKDPDIQAVFAANDMMALGVLQFLAESKRSDVLVAAFDALDEAKRAIREGKLQATVDQQAAEQGYLGVAEAVHMLEGEKASPVVLVDTRLVTLENVDQ